MNSRDYWRKREDEARKNTIRDEQEYNKRLNEIYQYMIANIERQVNNWYANYASKEGITMAEARGRVRHIDMERYERLAAKYVATHDFSDQANEEMALYNLTMKVNRLELLKAEINLELMAGFDDIEHEMERDLIRTAMKEDRRLAGILGDSVIGNEQYAKQLVNASFRNATFSERIWGRNMPDLRIHLEAELRNGLVQGIGSQELARRFRKHYGGSVKDTERLMATEMCRLQTAVQKESFERNGYKEYMFITSGEGNVCPDCQALHGQHFKVSEMQAGVNAPPMHPRCHCSAASYMDSDKYKRWIDALARGEDVRWNEFEAEERQGTIISESDVIRIKDEKGDNKKLSKKERLKRIDRKNDQVPISIFDIKTKEAMSLQKEIDKAPKLIKNFLHKNREDILVINLHPLAGNRLTEDGIRVDLVKDINNERGRFTAAFHEIGHRVDRILGRPSQAARYKFRECIELDFHNLVDNMKMQYNYSKEEDVFKSISANIEDPIFHSVSDLLGGLTNNKCTGIYGHSDEYWKEDHSLEREAFAHFFESIARKDAEKNKILREIFPVSFKVFLNMLKDNL